MKHTLIILILLPWHFCDFTHCSHTLDGWRYPLVGGARGHHFDGNSFKPRKLPENAQTPTSRVHAVLGGS